LLNPRLVLSGLLALSACPSLAETVSDFTLPNGLQVVVIEDHRAPVVTQMIWYRIGAADEPPGHSGIAHFLEHLMFKGTGAVPGEGFSTTVEREGGEDNAFTSWDYTAYFQRVAADRLELVMRMEADRMKNLVLTDDVVATEREVILAERGQVVDSSPGALLSEQMRATLFQNHAYGIPIIGWRHEMAELTREDALSVYADHYAPNNAVLILAGDVTPAEARRLAEMHYGPLPASEALLERDRPDEPPQIAPRRVSYADPRVSEPYVVRTYAAPERDPGDQKTAAALVHLAELLGGSGTTSELARALQFDSQIAVYSSAYYSGTALDDATFGISVLPRQGVSLEEAEAAMDKVIATFLETGPDPEAFARIKTQLRASEVYARDDVGGLARRYGEALSTGLSLQDVEDWPGVMQAVTPEDVMDAARLVLDPKRSVTGWLLTEDTAASQAEATP
jgi:zinc protease